MSETVMLTSNPYDGNRIAGTVGLPLPGVQVRVVDGEGRACSTGEIGGIEVQAGPNVFSGYWRMPEKTARGVHRRRLVPHRRRGPSVRVPTAT